MASAPRRRCRLVLASRGVAAYAILLALVTLWALCVLPFALIIGICAWRGMTLGATWERLSEESGEYAARGPAGLKSLTSGTRSCR